MPKYKPKLPVSTVTNALEFEPTDAFWLKVREHMGGLSADDKTRIERIIDTYCSNAQFEANAANLDLAEQRLAKIRGAAETFWQTLMPDGTTDSAQEANDFVEHKIDRDLEREHRSFFLAPASIPESEMCVTTWERIKRIIKRWLRKLRIHHPAESESLPSSDDEYGEWVRRDWVSRHLCKLSLREMVHTMTSFVSAGDSAGRELEAHRKAEHYAPGKSWEDMITAFAFMWLDLDLVVTAAKHSDGSRPPSPFVAFILDVHSHFPKRLRSHTQSTAALSGKVKIIARAKEEWRDAMRRDRVEKTSRAGRED